ncbi:hypothetical protein AB0K00_13370 [Dactylosporangium sp. NPDC049525]|uniref:hypothetical protein n=1 Tax=Dactylosporangium sp. NPDC049525 TaxID=3154730 RepID=UPI00342A57CB
MTAADGDAEPLRVPPWLTGNAPSPDPEHPQVGSQVPAAPDPTGATPDVAAVPARETPDAEANEAADEAANEAPGERVDGPADEAADWPVAPDRDGWHASGEPSALRGLLAPWRPRLLVAGVATVLSLLSILLASAFLGDHGPDRRAAPPTGTLSADVSVAVPGPSRTEATQVSPSPSPAPSPASRSPADASPTGPPRSSPPKFGPVTFEAEAPGNTLGGSAWVDRYPGASGGSIVRNIGDWGSRDGDGFLRFQNITVPADGTYTLRLFHVNIDNERTRTAVVTVAGRDPQPVTLSGSSACCTGSTLKVQLRKGGNTVTVSNPDGHAPSVDRIVLSLP